MDAAAQSRTQPPRGPRKRNRPAVSCGHCRIRKLKCSRTQPCDSCRRSGDTATCSYEAQHSHVVASTSEPMKRENLMARIDRLESLLVSAMAASGRPVGKIDGMRDAASLNADFEVYGNPAFSSFDLQRSTETGSLAVNGLTKDFRSMKVDQAENSSIYLGGVHWVSIMSEIEEFRNYLDDNHEQLERNALERRVVSKDVGRSPSLLRGTTTPASREELESYIPSRHLTDRLVNRFFSFYGSLRPIIHEPTFRKEYDMYWTDSTTAKGAWLGLLFAILHLAEVSYAEEPSTELTEVTGKYKLRTIQCLISADYTNAVGYTIETLMLYMEAEWAASQDPGVEVSMVLGLAIRLAMRMGIHRDSKAFPHLTPFRREMRRRLWAVIHSVDIFYSFQLSLPHVIRQSDCDCGLPMNIRIEEFREDGDLPPSRPFYEATEASYMIAKYEMLLVLGNIIEFTTIKGNNQVDSITKLEHSLLEIRQMIPPHLQVSEAVRPETTSLQKAQTSLDRIFQLGQCLLHRRILHRRNDPSALRRRRSCIDAAMKLLSYQSAIFLDSGLELPQNIRRRNISNLTSQDFFVAGMVVALDLYYGLEVEHLSPSPSDISIWGFSRRAEMASALETSTEFWSILMDESIGAAKAYGLFSFILTKVKNALVPIGEMATSKSGSEEQLEYVIDKELFDNMSEIDWELWDSYNGGEGRDIESYLQYPMD